MRLVAGLAVLACASLVATSARADDASEMEFTRTRFNSGLYDEAVKRLTVLLDASKPLCEKGPPGGCKLGDSDLIEEARSLDVIALIALGRPAEADAQIEQILRANPSFVAGPPLFTVKVADRFTEVRARIKDDLIKIQNVKAQAAHLQQVYDDQMKTWMEDMKRLAGDEAVVQQNSRVVAMLPFGAGQFQNGKDALGIFFAISEGTLGAASISFAAAAYANSNLDINDPAVAAQGANLADLNNRIKTLVLVNRVFFSLWGAATLAGIVQAQIAFVPERELPNRKRPIPAQPKPPVLPTVSVVPGGFGLGLQGSF